jgi:sulfur carrier protein
MIVAVNGVEREISDGATITGVLAALDVPGHARGVAVAVEGEVVPRGRWTTTRLREGDRVEVLSAVQGG